MVFLSENKNIFGDFYHNDRQVQMQDNIQNAKEKTQILQVSRAFLSKCALSETEGFA